MNVEGLIKFIVVDGYEMLMSVQTENREICFNYLQSNEYFEPGQTSQIFAVNEMVSFSASLRLVVGYEPVDSSVEQGISQPISKSPHAIVIGEVVEKLDSDCYVLLICKKVRLTVFFEENVELESYIYIRVSGELTVESD